MNGVTNTAIDPWEKLDNQIRRMISSARAAKGYTWEDLAKELQIKGWDITAGNLMTRHSRCAFRADEVMLIMNVLGVQKVDVPSIE